MAEHSSPYALAAPQEVDADAIERELEELWRAAHADGESAVLRAAAMNLLYVTSGAHDDARDADLVARLTVENPSRAILVQLDENDSSAALRAWVTAYCRRPTASSPQVCSEFIQLRSGAANASALASAFLTLRLSGLPTVLIWDNRISVAQPLLAGIAPHCERLIVSVVPPCGDALSLRNLVDIGDRFPKTFVTDAVESLYQPWQQSVARLFDAQPDAVPLIRQIEICGPDHGISAEFLYILAWITSVLEWQPEKFSWRAEGLDIVFAEGRLARFRSDPKLPQPEIRFECDRRDSTRLLIANESPCENRWEELLLKQLQIWTENPARKAMWKPLREFLEALEMASPPTGIAHA